MKKEILKFALIFLTAIAAPFASHAQNEKDPLTIDRSLPLPKLTFDGKGELVITPSITSSANDFDFLVGTWKLTNKRLKCRLGGCTEWSAPFESKVVMTKMLNGIGNIDNYYDNSSGKNYEGVAVRLFNPKTKLWSIYWADSNIGAFDPPMVGSFENNVGHFFCKDTFNGRPILVVFRWDVRNPKLPVWSQAFSADNGKTWEWNTINVSEKVN